MKKTTRLIALALVALAIHGWLIGTGIGASSLRATVWSMDSVDVSRWTIAALIANTFVKRCPMCSSHAFAEHVSVPTIAEQALYIWQGLHR